MATYTSNYAWTKPSGNDNVDISVLNANLDSQDSIMHDAFANMAQAFSESSTYEVGDIVVYGTTTYKCHTAVTTAGSWTGSTNWQVYKLSEGGSGGGGTSNYNDLTNKPSINGVTLSGNKTASDLSLQDKMQYSTMPTASADNEGKIYQYVGTTDANYINGYYYKCVENSGSYSWQLVENIKEQTPTFSQASTRNNIASGEKLSVIMGKIQKFFNDLKTVAFSGNASDLNYDNTTSGLSATKTQGAIDELAGDIDELTNNSISNSINIIAYTAIDNYYTAPSDGFVRFKGTSSDIAFVALVRDNLTSVNISSSNGLTTGVFVKKGTKLFVYTSSVGTAPSEAYFIGYTS